MSEDGFAASDCVVTMMERVVCASESEMELSMASCSGGTAFTPRDNERWHQE